jgi:hypothetical protein
VKKEKRDGKRGFKGTRFIVSATLMLGDFRNQKKIAGHMPNGGVKEKNRTISCRPLGDKSECVCVKKHYVK